MTSPDDSVQVDFSNLYTIADGDDSFVSLLLMKMCAALPLAYDTMETAVAAQDWPTLKSAAHKAKSTFAYLSLDEMRDKLKNIEHDATEETNLETLPQQVEEAVVLGKRIQIVLEAKLAEIS